MSNYTLEGILFQLQVDPSFRSAFLSDPVAAVAERPLTVDEREELIAWDVAGMSARGVSDMLLLGTYMTLNGPASVPEYMRRMSAGLA